MKLGIGDVVRDRHDHTLGTVTALHRRTNGNAVEILIAPRVVRTLKPADVEQVARGTRPMTTSRTVATLLFLALAVASAVVNVLYLRQIHADFVMEFFVAVASVSLTFSALDAAFLRTRRTRI